MWQRNLLFIGLCLFGASAIAVSLLPANRIEEPASFDPGRFDKEEFGVVVEQVNDEFREHWKQAGVEPAEPADNLLIARRVSLALTGTVPSLEEIRTLESKPSEHQIEWWVSHLLEDERYAEYVAERLTRAYVGVEGGPFLVYRRSRFVDWLAEQLAANTPYDELASQLIADKGLWTSTPAVNFVSVTIQQDEDKGPDPVRLAARTTRAFLGMRIDCLQCHDNNLGDEFLLGSGDEVHDGTEQDFHQLAAFFAQSQVMLSGIRDDPDRTYEHQYLYADEAETVEAEFPYLKDLDVSGETLRERLANWVTHEENKPFARAIVNRMWALMVGQPLIEQIDDIPLYGLPDSERALARRMKAGEMGRPISGRRWWFGDAPFPPGMETLAEDFIEHNYDLQRLIRLIASTQMFQADSWDDSPITRYHESVRAIFPHTRLRPEQIARSITQSCSVTTIDANSHIVAQLQQFFQQNEFIQRYGDTGEDEFSSHGGTINQRLMLMNGKLAHEVPQFKQLLTNASSQILRFAPDRRTAIETVYLTALSRQPSSLEMQILNQAFAEIMAESGQTDGGRIEFIEDIYWAMINKTEFMWNH